MAPVVSSGAIVAPFKHVDESHVDVLGTGELFCILEAMASVD